MYLQMCIRSCDEEHGLSVGGELTADPPCRLGFGLSVEPPLCRRFGLVKGLGAPLGE